MGDARISLWNFYKLFTQANESSYIDNTLLDRNLNAFDFTKGIQQSFNGNSDYHWFLSWSNYPYRNVEVVYFFNN